MRTTALVLVAPTLVLYNGKGLELKPPVYCDAVVNAKKAHGVSIDLHLQFPYHVAPLHMRCVRFDFENMASAVFQHSNVYLLNSDTNDKVALHIEDLYD